MALVVGSVFLACSGSIETPTDEFPQRSRSTAADDDDEDSEADDAPQSNSQTANAPRPPAAPAQEQQEEDEDDAPAAGAGDDDEPPVSEPPPAGDDEEPPPAAGGASLAFETDIWPIFNSTCGPCHAGLATAGVDIGNEDIEAAFEDSTAFEDRVIARIELGGMPPACAGGAPGDANCISEEDFAKVQEWYEAGAPE